MIAKIMAAVPIVTMKHGFMQSSAPEMALVLVGPGDVLETIGVAAAMMVVGPEAGVAYGGDIVVVFSPTISMVVPAVIMIDIGVPSRFIG